MTTRSSDNPQPLAELVSYFFTRREAILNNWRIACENDTFLGKISTLSRDEFNNLIPIVLTILEKRLMKEPEDVDPAIAATSHGLHRWQKSHALLETIRELNHFTQILYNELEAFHVLFPKTEARFLLQVHRLIAQFMSETIDGSVQKYDELQRLEAANRASSLQKVIDQMTELSHVRGTMLRTTSHDLRGSFGIINSAAHLLKMDGLSQEERDQFLEMLNRNLTNVQSMLGNLTDLSRLEAGEDMLQIQTIDVVGLVKKLVDDALPLANERGLILTADGPELITAQTDPAKLHQIAFHLLQNALQYTSSGFISVSWITENDFHWILSIQDSGAGISGNLAGLLTKQLKPNVEPVSVMSPDQSDPVSVLPKNDHSIPEGPVLAQTADNSTHREGVSLQLVKRLCELLDASLEIETEEGRGSLFRIRFPVHYNN
ncbi:HAMP domain-containing sensor histidine kinase [Spirosoma sp.]|uniref:sensor histidine kinase n=1 Tax=Spirosoma sp. TaxID=1899569 RepID=UPI0026150518|nr:HAMP domain-containing sensor histidine kinase [Spirosoma sp.]MCX6215016.1 HAMP domain-containing sensor histidine kinase [Spirosoma sp.]